MSSMILMKGVMEDGRGVVLAAAQRRTCWLYVLYDGQLKESVRRVLCALLETWCGMSALLIQLGWSQVHWNSDAKRAKWKIESK